MVGECVIANNSEPVLAHKLAEYLLTAEAQSAGLQHGNQIPSNPKAPAVGDDSKLKLKQFEEYMKTAVVVDWDAINESRPAWNARWNRIIER
jgi:putative spermidine/putrescine transport system substrate-binding protein